MINVELRNAPSVVPLKHAQTAENYSVTTAPTNVNAGMNLSVKLVRTLQDFKGNDSPPLDNNTLIFPIR